MSAEVKHARMDPLDQADAEAVCLYVALAERDGCELVTADARLLDCLGRQFPLVTALSSL